MTCKNFKENMCIYVEGHVACQGKKDACPDIHDLHKEYIKRVYPSTPQERLGSLCRAAERI